MLPHVEKFLMVEWDDELGYYVPVDPQAPAKGCIRGVLLGAVCWIIILSLVYLAIHLL
jgi:hypothetical protein